ncbi:hypothetical protein M0802_011588 [Mischocyttarus mexicanus]|nr:hypothetical protein M0802_011588 [Mischocyttarus mexicanus]
MQGDGIRGGEPRGLPLDIKILPERLRSLGYTTKLIGKWHIGYHTAQHTPLHRGFDSFLGFYNSHVSYYEKYDKSVELPSYAETIVKSSVSETITYYLGGPVTQPSTIVHLRQEATVTCPSNLSYHLKTSSTLCNTTQCLYDLENDPCETRNIVNQYPRGWNDVSFNGANQIPTPNIDALAYNGVILQKHYTLPTCTPSRTAFLTGYYPIRQGMEGVPLLAGEKRAIPKSFKLLPEYLQDLGYLTHLVGKWHVGYYAPRYTPTRRGFNTFYGYYNGYIEYWNHTTSDHETGLHLGNDLHRDKPNKLSPEFATGYFTDLLTEEAEQIIFNHDPVTPLYLQIAHLAMHSSGLKNGEELQVKDMKKVNETFGYIKDINRRKLAGKS